MQRWSAFFIVMLVLVSVIAFDPDVNARAQDIWEALQPVLAELKEGLAVIFYEITNKAPDIPSQNIPPFDDSPIYNAWIGKLPG